MFWVAPRFWSSRNDHVGVGETTLLIEIDVPICASASVTSPTVGEVNPDACAVRSTQSLAY